MKTNPVLKFLCGILLLQFAVFGVTAQETNANVQQNQSETQVLGENERIPFMQTEESAKQADSGSGSLILRTFGAMLLIVGVIFFGAWTMKKLGFVKSPAVSLSDAPELSVLNSVSIGNNQTISAIKFGEKILLVGSTAQSFTLLAENAGNEAINAENPRSVAELLAEENFDFEAELSQAQKRLGLFQEKGEEI
ncbi:MAG: flagellar biosynthetic protein FliO [Pyrinomonadaceae bacterium]|nr:flagellar biosynthetic protein FliO [Pyrinomonadaceae bacterium]